MKRIKQAISGMLVAALSCGVLAGQAFAASGDALWADLDETSGEVAAVIETNGVVTDGVIDVTFDADKLTYVGCDFEGKEDQYAPYVAMYAVNDTQADQGVIKISWVAPDTFAANGDTTALFQVNFQGAGVAAEDLTVSGAANDNQGQAVAVGQKPTPSVTPSATPSTNPSANPDVGNTGNDTDTGDHANLPLYVGLLSVCVVVLAGLGIWNYKRRAAK